MTISKLRITQCAWIAVVTAFCFVARAYSQELSGLPPIPDVRSLDKFPASVRSQKTKFEKIELEGDIYEKKVMEARARKAGTTKIPPVDAGLDSATGLVLPSHEMEETVESEETPAVHQREAGPAQVSDPLAELPPVPDLSVKKKGKASTKAVKKKSAKAKQSKIKVGSTTISGPRTSQGDIGGGDPLFTIPPAPNLDLPEPQKVRSKAPKERLFSAKLAKTKAVDGGSTSLEGTSFPVDGGELGNLPALPDLNNVSKKTKAEQLKAKKAAEKIRIGRQKFAEASKVSSNPAAEPVAPVAQVDYGDSDELGSLPGLPNLNSKGGSTKKDERDWYAKAEINRAMADELLARSTPEPATPVDSHADTGFPVDGGELGNLPAVPNLTATGGTWIDRYRAKRQGSVGRQNTAETVRLASVRASLPIGSVVSSPSVAANGGSESGNGGDMMSHIYARAYGGDDSPWAWRNPFAAFPGGMLGDGSQGAIADGDIGSEAGTASPDTPATDPNTPLMASLSGIVLYPRTIEVRTSGVSRVDGVINKGVILPPSVQISLERYIGQPLSFGQLNTMVREAIQAYRDSDIPVVDVLVPEQEVTSGTLQLVVITARRGDILVENNKYTASGFLRANVTVEKGEVLRESELLTDIDWINRHPFRQVELIYTPGALYGTSDLILKTQDVRHLTGHLAYENSGNEVLGEDRLLAGFSWANSGFFGRETIFSYQYSTGLNDADITGHSGVVTSFLPWRHQLTLLGAHVKSSANLDVAGEVIETGGVNNSVGVRYAVPLKRRRGFNHEFEIGYDFKSSNSDLFFNSLEVFDTTSEIAQFSLGYNMSQRDRWGTTEIDTEVVLSPGDITGANSTEAFQQQRSQSSADYVYFRASVERKTPIKGGWELIARGQGQYSNSNLLPSETLGGGGYDSVRGFEQRVVRGDTGGVGTVELRTPAIPLAKMAGFYNARDALIGLVFADYGYLESVDILEDEIGSFGLGSVGVGLRYQLDDKLTIRIDYGYQIEEDGFDDEQTARFHVGARASF